MSKKIMVIDDEQSLVNMITMRLKKHGYEVITAFDGFNGVNQALEERPDLILLDIILPAGGGISVFENLRVSEETMSIPVILMSGLLAPKDLEKKAAQFGAEDFIAKPFESEELIRKIKGILGE